MKAAALCTSSFANRRCADGTARRLAKPGPPHGHQRTRRQAMRRVHITLFAAAALTCSVGVRADDLVSEQVGRERRDRRGQLPDAGAGAAGRPPGEDRQGLFARHHRQHDDAGVPAAHLLDLHRAARPDRLGRRPRPDQHHLQRRHPQLLERHRHAARRARPHRRRRPLLQRPEVGRVRDHRRPEEARHREDPADGGARRAARHGGALRRRRRQGRHGLQPGRDRRRRREAGRARSARATSSSSTPAG